MSATLNHIGIAVRQTDSLKRLFEILDLKLGHTEEVKSQGVITHFIELPKEAAALELLEVTDPNGTIAKFLDKRGPGVHHLSFLLTQGTLDQKSIEITNAGFKLIYANAQMGAHQMRVNFIHPSLTEGVLIEIMERSL